MDQEYEYLKSFIDNPPPIPGQSLTNDLKNPRPYEKAPKYVSIHEASEFLLTQLMEEDNYVGIMTALMEGHSVMEITQVLLFTGFYNGLWNPDLQMLLVEPTAYMVLMFAERAGLKDVKIYEGEEDDEAEEERRTSAEGDIEILRSLKAKQKTVANIPGLNVNPKVAAKIEDLPTAEQFKGLMER